MAARRIELEWEKTGLKQGQSWKGKEHETKRGEKEMEKGGIRVGLIKGKSGRYGREGTPLERKHIMII